MPDTDTIWAQLLDRMRPGIDSDEYRRWFSNSTQASDSGDQLTVWVPSQADVRHITLHYLDRIYRELAAMNRFHVTVRFIATGYDDDEDEWEE
ncbi:MAG: DnaA N-terminal domain-containing protein [Vicinamibacterales bacterium]